MLSPAPLTQLTAVLRVPEMMLQPSAGDARLTLGRLLRGVVESAKAFVRWMDGTCVCCEAPASGESLPLEHTHRDRADADKPRCHAR